MKQACLSAIGIFSLSGRASRGDYWLAFGIALAVHLIAGFAWLAAARMVPASGASGAVPMTAWALLAIYGLIVVANAIFFMATATRRCHDADISAWYIIMLVVPLLNLIFWAYLGVKKGNPEPNKYGDPPGLFPNAPVVPPRKDRGAEQATER